MEAGKIFEGLINSGRRELEQEPPGLCFAPLGKKRTLELVHADNHCLIGLGLLGMGKSGEAGAEFEKVFSLNASHLGARTRLAQLD